MQYLGGKSKIRKQVSQFLESVRKDGQTYFEPFVGGGWVLQEGWEPPDFVSEEEWRYWRKQKETIPEPMMAFSRFGCGFGGDWMGGYARSADKDCYAATSKRSLLKQLPKIKDVEFIQGTFEQHSPINCLIYCDPPYQGTTAYGAFDSFDHELFWDTMRSWSKNNTVVISEYVAPDDFICVKQFESRMGLTTKQDTGTNERPKRVEKLFMHNSLTLS